MDSRIIKTAAKLGAAVGVSRWTIQAIRKAGKILGDPLPNYSTPNEGRKWLRRHPDFVAGHYLKKPEQLCSSSSQEPATADKSGELSHLHAPRMPSPVVSEHQPALVG